MGQIKEELNEVRKDSKSEEDWGKTKNNEI